MGGSGDDGAGHDLRGQVSFIVIPSRVAWWSADAADTNGWMHQTNASDISRELPHWSMRERTESPYLSDDELASLLALRGVDTSGAGAFTVRSVPAAPRVPRCCRPVRREPRS